MSTLTSHQYWNTIGCNKQFEDPLYIEKLSPFINPTSKIIEYGCGYGRLMQILKEHGYHHVTGFDFAEKMIERGKRTNPNLDMHLLLESGKIPCQDESVDLVLMSTILCCMIYSAEQIKLLEEIRRVLKKKGALYISDFLVCEDPRYERKYLEGYQKFGKWGVYTTSENLAVYHMTSQSVFALLNHFDIRWFEQFDFKTMNNNPAKTFHCIGIKTD